MSSQDRLDPATSEIWAWFEVHSSQRMQVLGFWLVALGLVTSAYAQTIAAGLRSAAAVIAMMGAVISFLFVLLDRRTRNLVKIAEAEFASTGTSAVTRMISASNGSRLTYTRIIALIEFCAVTGLLLLAAYAIWCPVDSSVQR